MARFFTAVLAVAVCLSFSGCSLLGIGGGGGAYKPTECMDNAFMGDLSDAKPGKSVTYTTTPGDMKVTVKVVGKEGDLTLVEHWMEMPSMSYGFLYKVGGDKKVKEAYAAAKDDKEWTKITVKETPKPQGGTDGPKPTIKESNEKKEVKAGTFDCKKLDVTVNVQGKDYNSLSWYSKDIPKLYISSPDHGGLVASEGSGAKTILEAKADDAKASAIEMPKK